jgi:hypothetical protein
MNEVNGVNNGAFYLRVPNAVFDPNSGCYVLPWHEGGVQFPIDFGVMQNSNEVHGRISSSGLKLDADVSFQGDLAAVIRLGGWEKR